MNGKRYIKTLTILCSLVPAIVLGILGYIFISVETNKSIMEGLKETVSTYQAGFLSKLEVQTEKVESLGLTSEVGNLLLESLNCMSLQEVKDLDKSKVETLLKTTSSQYQDKIQYSLFTAEGIFLTGSVTGNTSLSPEECEAARCDATVSLFQNSATIRILAPIISHETTVGYLAADISSEYFQDFLTKSEDDKMFHTFLATRQGEYVLLTPADNTNNYTISSQQLK